MKNRILIVPIVAMLLCCSCFQDDEVRHVRGYLYSDSTKSEPMAGEVLSFYRSATPIGTATTDAMGRWGLWYTNQPLGGGDMAEHSAKFQLTDYTYTIKHGDDTLYLKIGHLKGDHFGTDSLTLYVGDTSWHHNYYRYN